MLILAVALAGLLPNRLRAADPAVIPPGAPDLVGCYYGEEVNFPIQDVLKLWRDDAGRLRGTYNNLAHGDRNRGLSAIFEDGRNLRLEFDWSVTRATGKLSEDGSKLDMVYFDGDFVYPYSMKRVDASRFVESRFSDSREATGPGRVFGAWNGTVEWEGLKLRHVLRLGRFEDGRLGGTLDILDCGQRNLPVTGIQLTNRTVRIECRQFPLSFSGELSEDSTRLQLTLERGKLSCPANFTRTEKPWILGDSSPLGSGPDLAKEVEGEWVGLADRQSTFSEISLRFGREPDGRTGVRLLMARDEPDAAPLISTRLEIAGPEITAEWVDAFWFMTRITFQGRVEKNAERDRIVGTLVQDDNITPAVLQRSPSRTASAQRNPTPTSISR